jgi:hypothetical protein
MMRCYLPGTFAAATKCGNPQFAAHAPPDPFDLQGIPGRPQVKTPQLPNRPLRKFLLRFKQIGVPLAWGF